MRTPAHTYAAQILTESQMPFGLAHFEHLMQHTSPNRFHDYCVIFVSQTFTQYVFDAQGFSYVDTSAQLTGNPTMLRSCLGFAHTTKVSRVEPSVLIFWTLKPVGVAKFIILFVRVQNAVGLIILHKKIRVRKLPQAAWDTKPGNVCLNRGRPPWYP